MMFWLPPVFLVALFLFPWLVNVVQPGSYQKIWLFFGVGSLDQTFGDLRVILAGWEAIRDGLNPYLSNPTDPWERLYNYPPIWLYGAATGFGQEATNAIGTVFLALFLLTIGVLSKRLPRQFLPYWLLVLMSPPALLAMERGNIDLVVFSLVFLALPYSRLRFPAVALAACMKIFPLFALPMARVGNRWKAALVTLSAVMFYLLWEREKIALALKATPTPIMYAFGGRVIFLRAGVVLHERFGIDISQTTVMASFWLLLLIVSLGVAALAFRGKQEEQPDLYFLAGAGVFLGSFIFNANWNYRLIFLLPMIPYITGLANKPRQQGLVLIALKMWMDRFQDFRLILLADDLVGWITYAWVLYHSLRMILNKASRPAAP